MDGRDAHSGKVTRDELLAQAAELYEAYLERFDRGDPENYDALCDTYPEHAPLLRRLARADAQFGTDPEPASVTATVVPKKLEQAFKRIASRGLPFERYEDKGGLVPPGVTPKGGQGRMRRLWDLDLQRPVVQKLLRVEGAGAIGGTGFDAPRAGRLLDEARITGQLEHPGIVPVHELGLTPDGELYFTMKQVEGRDLDEVFEEYESGTGELTRERILTMIIRACEAVGYAHDRGVLHRDLKPENIRVGDFGEVYVMDWGLARSLDATDILPTPGKDCATHLEQEDTRWTVAGYTPGTRGYLAPERIRKGDQEAGTRSDVYGMGAVLYRWLTGVKPYHEGSSHPTDAEYVERATKESAPSVNSIRRNVPAQLAAICDKAMAHDPVERYGNMRELSDDLQAFLDRRTVKAWASGPWAELMMWVRRNPLGGVAAAAVGLLGLLSVAFMISTNSNAKVARALYSSTIARAQLQRLRGDIGGLEALESSSIAQRGWEYRYLKRAFTPGSVQFQHEAGSPVRMATFMPDSADALSVADEGTLRRWSSLTGEQNWMSEDFGDAVYVVAVHPAGKMIACATHGGIIRTLDADTGKLIRRFQRVPAHRMNQEGSPSVIRLAFHPTLNELASVGMDGHVRIWNLNDGTLAREKRVTQGAVYGLDIAPDGKELATSGQDRRETGTNIKRFRWQSLEPISAHRVESVTGVLALTYTPSQFQLLGIDVKLHVIDLESGDVRSLDAHGQPALAIGIANDGKSVLTGSLSGFVKCWDLQNLTLRWQHRPIAAQVRSIQFSRDGQRILMGSKSGEARVFPPHSTEDGTPLVAAVQLEPLQQDTARGAVAISPDGHTLVSGNDNYQLHVYDLETLQSYSLPSIHQNRITTIDWLNAQQFVAGDSWGGLILWDLLSEPQHQQLDKHSQDVSHVRIDRKRQRMISIDLGGKIRLWDTQDWSFKEHDLELGSLTALEINPAHGRIAIGTSAGEVMELDPDQNWLAREFQSHGQDGVRAKAVNSLSYLPDGRLISVGSDRQGILHSANGRESTVFVQSKRELFGTVVFDGGARVGVTGWDGHLRIFDCRDWMQILRLQAQLLGSERLATTPDGNLLVSAGLTNTLLLYDGRERLTDK